MDLFFSKSLAVHCVKSVQTRNFSGPHFPVFRLNTGKTGPGKAPYLNTFHAVVDFILINFILIFIYK